jgi:hypothetical protein
LTTAAVDDRISGEVHPHGCPAHQSVKDAITITWDATLPVGDEVMTMRETEGGN